MTQEERARQQSRPFDAGGSHVLSVQVGRPREHEWLGRTVRTSIFKATAAGPVAVRRENVEGDDQSDRRVHGGADRAVYAYSREDEDWWQAELGRPVQAGTFGENLTTVGLDLRAATIGETWRVGTALLQVSEPRTPCWKLGLRMGDHRFPRAFAAARRSGVFLRVLAEGLVQAGDDVTVTSRPRHGVSVDAVNRLYYGLDRDLAPIERAPELSAHWRTWAEHRSVWHLEEDNGG